jgi:hypothetical protein
MPQPGDDDQDDVLQLTEDQQVGAEGDQQNDGDSESDADGDRVEAGDDENGTGADDEETVVSFGDAPDVDQEGDSTVIRQLRKQLREANERIRSVEHPTVQKRELRPEPTSEDHAFDDDAFKADYRAWLQEKAEIDRDQEQATEASAQIQREWEADIARFEQRKSELKVDDLEDAQDAVAGALSLAQQAAVVKAADNPALVFYALGKSPAKLAEVAKVKDIIKFAAAIAKVEGTVKVTKRRKGPALDRPQRGSGVLVSSDKKLAQLEKQAEETGDRTELVRYRKELAERSKKK